MSAMSKRQKKHQKEHQKWKWMIIVMGILGMFGFQGCASEVIKGHALDALEDQGDIEEGIEEGEDGYSDGSSGGEENSGGGEGEIEDGTDGSSTGEAICGNGEIEGDEECDDGELNSNSADQCRTNCRLPKCGDRIQDSGEGCDDGNLEDGDGCSSSCELEGSEAICGNGIVEVGEACDDGVNNSDQLPDACRTNCKAARCGDGVVDTGERCDDGDTVDNNACSNTCIPVTEYLCHSCSSDDECGRSVDRCLPLGGGNACAVACDLSLGEGCPEGYLCEDYNGEGTYCMPESGGCSEMCTNGIDDDGDGDTDCADEECSREPLCGEEVCDDNFDNDGDGQADCEDEECAMAPNCYDACAPEHNPCPDIPPNECDVTGQYVLTYGAHCTEVDEVAECTYPSSVLEDCGAQGLVCNNGECTDLCNGMVCDEAPADYCDGEVLRIYYTPTCEVNNGSASCTYPESTQDCSVTNQICADGACHFLTEIPNPAHAGDVIFTEFMPDPRGSDQTKEWFEVYNTTSHAFQLGGCEISRASGSSTANFTVKVTGDILLVNAHSHASLGVTRTVDSIGFEPDYVYSGSTFQMAGLTNSSLPDVLTLTCNGIVIDQAEIQSMVEGSSRSLDVRYYDGVSNDDDSHWCNSTLVYHTDDYGNTNMGTPGSENPICP